MLPTRNTVVELRSFARRVSVPCSAFLIGGAYHDEKLCAERERAARGDTRSCNALAWMWPVGLRADGRLHGVTENVAGRWIRCSMGKPSFRARHNTPAWANALGFWGARWRFHFSGFAVNQELSPLRPRLPINPRRVAQTGMSRGASRHSLLVSELDFKLPGSGHRPQQHPAMAGLPSERESRLPQAKVAQW